MTNVSAELRQRLEAKRGNQGASIARDIVIGKDILELLSSAMYVDPLTIYREYIQNAADAIDNAYSKGVLTEAEQGRIDISVDIKQRSIRIRDNGTGIPSEVFEQLLTSFGASQKRGTSARGFRGVGRLAGLGYCQTLIFRSRSTEHEPVLEMKWDCRKLKAALLDPTFEGDLADLVREIVTVSHLELAEAPAHFFEVELEKVLRIKNDLLLNESEIMKYLSQVAPLPFSPDFEFGAEIEQRLAEHLPARNFLVYFQGQDEPLYRPFRDSFRVTDTTEDTFDEIEFIETQGQDGELASIGWIMHHSYLGAIQGQPEIKGLRARVGDIQVGEHNIFEEAFPELRFNSWTVGELHVLDRRIAPNGRRDNFEQNGHHASLLNQLLPFGREIGKRCRNNSLIRNRIKAFEIEEQKVVERLEILEQGAVNRQRKEQINKEIGTSFGIMKQTAAAELLSEQQSEKLLERLEDLQDKALHARPTGSDASPLSRIPVAKRNVYEEVIGLIYECANNQVVAKSLVDKILARITLMD